MSSLRKKIGDIIFEHDTPPSNLFDVLLLIAILFSVLLVMLESVSSVKLRFGNGLKTLEWTFTTLFTIEYITRLYVAHNRRKYLRSFFGVVDLLAILPSYLSLLFVGSQYFIVIRSLRLLRVFRILKLVQFVGEATVLAKALKASQAKITVFMITVVTLVIIIGSVMYLVEGPANGFTNIPVSVYWAIVTLTTVGFGDITPKTPLGQLFAALVMILGYAIIAVPTGIVSVELGRADQALRQLRCINCHKANHEADAKFCKYCGESLGKL